MAAKIQLLDELLWQSNNKWQIRGASLGVFIGLFLLLLSAQTFFDLQTLMGESSSRDRYVVINKEVNFFNTLGASAAFTEEEISELREQSFVRSVGIFTSNQFKVSATSKTLGFYTDLFFESVPDEYLDLNNSRFRWEEGDSRLPIILSRDYLALYNFGFAPSQGLPQFTPGTIQKVSMEIILKSPSRRQSFSGQIVGFSDRFNSILVPQEFMDWANEAFGSGEALPSRLILEVDNPLSRDLNNFLDEQNYEISSGRLIGGQFATLISLVLGILGFIGLTIVLLAFLIFSLNFQLLIARARQKISLLIQIGYRRRQIYGLLENRLLRQLLIVLVFTLIALTLCRFFQVQWLYNQGFSVSAWPHWVVILLAVLFSALFIFLNFRSIRRSVEKLGK
jgi:hypothetical protein